MTAVRGKEQTDEFQYVVLRVHAKQYRIGDDGVWLSLARAPGLGPGSRRFESCHPDQMRASGSVGGVQPCQGWGRGFESRLALLKLNMLLWLSR